MTKGKYLYFFLYAVMSSLLLTACHRDNIVSIPGYVEGRYSYISANYAGVLATLNVVKGDEVTIGQLLFVLVQEPESDELKMAEDRVKQASEVLQSQVDEFNLQKLILQRRLNLIKKNVVTQEEVDTDLTKELEASANLEAQKFSFIEEQSELSRAKWIASQKTVASPINGLVFDTYFNPGEVVEYGNPVLALLDANQVKIIFYIPEIWLNKLKLGQIIESTCDSCDTPVKSKVVFISPSAEFTPPVIYSNEERGKLVYRVEAAPLVKKSYQVIHPGQPVTIQIKLE